MEEKNFEETIEQKEERGKALLEEEIDGYIEEIKRKERIKNITALCVVGGELALGIGKLIKNKRAKKNR